MLREFKAFISKGNVIDLAVGFVMGAAFTAVVTAVVEDLVTPLIAAIFGKPDFSAISFTLHNSVFPVGKFMNALIAFLSVAAGVFFFIIKPVNHLNERRARGQAEVDPSSKQCTECLSEIPIAARRCSSCAQPQTSVA